MAPWLRRLLSTGGAWVRLPLWSSRKDLGQVLYLQLPVRFGVKLRYSIRAVSRERLCQIISSPLPANVTVEMAQVFLNRLNSSLYLWNQGIYNSTNSTIDSDALIEANCTLAEGADKARQVIYEFVILCDFFNV